MISVDDRTGSIELLPFLQSHPHAPPVSSCRLPSGDVAFDGLGPKGRSTIGIERKRVKDMMNSIRSGRYSGHQLPELLGYYEEFFLFVEGVFREGNDGRLEILLSKELNDQKPAYKSGYASGKWFTVATGSNDIGSPYRYTELDHFLCTIESHTPVKVRRTNSIWDTVDQILSLYSHRQKPWDKHHAYEAIYAPQITATIGKASLVRRVAAALSGIGWEKSGNIDVKFSSVEDMLQAGPKEWATIPGIGKTLADRAFKQLRGQWVDPKEL